MRGLSRAHGHAPWAPEMPGPAPVHRGFPCLQPQGRPAQPCLQHTHGLIPPSLSPQIPWLVKNRALSTTPIQFKGGSPETSVASPHFSLLSTLATT